MSLKRHAMFMMALLMMASCAKEELSDAIVEESIEQDEITVANKSNTASTLSHEQRLLRTYRGLSGPKEQVDFVGISGVPFNYTFTRNQTITNSVMVTNNFTIGAVGGLAGELGANVAVFNGDVNANGTVNLSFTRMTGTTTTSAAAFTAEISLSLNAGQGIRVFRQLSGTYYEMIRRARPLGEWKEFTIFVPDGYQISTTILGSEPKEYVTYGNSGNTFYDLTPCWVDDVTSTTVCEQELFVDGRYSLALDRGNNKWRFSRGNRTVTGTMTPISENRRPSDGKITSFSARLNPDFGQEWGLNGTVTANITYFSNGNINEIRVSSSGNLRYTRHRNGDNYLNRNGQIRITNNSSLN